MPVTNRTKDRHAIKFTDRVMAGTATSLQEQGEFFTLVGS